MDTDSERYVDLGLDTDSESKVDLSPDTDSTRGMSTFVWILIVRGIRLGSGY